MTWVFVFACIGLLLMLGEMVMRYLKEVEGTRRQGEETHLKIQADLEVIEEARKSTEQVKSRGAQVETEVQSIKERLTRGFVAEIEQESRELKRHPTRHKLDDIGSSDD